MDHLQTLIQALNTEKKDFLSFIQRYSEKENRKDLELFHLLTEETKHERADLLRKIYPKDENLEAYHATRKRLFSSSMTSFLSAERRLTNHRYLS